LLGKDNKEWELSKSKAQKTGRKVLFATSIGEHIPSLSIDSILSVSVVLRGVDAEFLLCDGILPACAVCEVNWYQNNVQNFIQDGLGVKHCTQCLTTACDSIFSLGLNINLYSSFLDKKSMVDAHSIAQSTPEDEITQLEIDGIKIGEHALTGALRFFARGELEVCQETISILRKYLEASILTFYVAKNLFNRNNYECIVLHHGIYVPQGVIADVAKKHDIRVVTWHPAYRNRCFIFSHHDTYHHTLLNEPISEWENISWSAKFDNKISNYLKSRMVGNDDWISFLNSPEFDLKKIELESGVDFSRPCIGLLTNVVWDAQLHYPANAFKNMLDWLKSTIEYFSMRPDLQLLIRIHPAEVTGGNISQQKVIDEIKLWFKILPNNIFIINPESSISTYVAMSKCNSVLIYGTKTGVELACMGIPVIVAGEAWIRGKGITLDIDSKAAYLKKLDKLPIVTKTSNEITLRAKKYAFHFFFRRMIPLSFMVPTKNRSLYSLNIKSIDELKKGEELGLDIICNGITNGGPFIYPYENESI